MALFEGEEIVDVTTPDGRTMRLPRSVLNTLQMPQPAAVPDMPQLGTPPVAAAGPLAPGVPAAPPVVQEAPKPILPDPTAEAAPAATVELGEPETRRVTEQQLAKEQKQQAARAATPAGKMAAVTGMQNNAIGNEAQAHEQVADIDAANLAMQGSVFAHRNKEIEKHEKKLVADAQAQIAAEDKKLAEHASMRKKIEGTKIDRKADHPILAALSVALYEIGAGMKGEKFGGGLQILYNALDRKVAAQQADLDQMVKVYGLSRDDLEALREKGKRQLELNNLMIAAETNKAIRQLDEMTARSNSEKVKANAQVLRAQLEQRAADKSMEALRWGLDYDQKDRAERNQNARFSAQLKQADRHHADNAQLKREEMYLNYQKSLADSKAKGDELAYKQKLELINKNEERGINNVVTNTPLLNKRGQDMLDQANKLLEEAKTVREIDAKGFDPVRKASAAARAHALEEKAAILQADADIYGRLRARSDVEARELGKKYGASQSVMTLVDEIKKMYDENGGRSYISTDAGRAAIQSKMGELSVALKDSWQLGAWDKGSAQLVSNITGGDPTKGWDQGVMVNMLTGFAGTDPEAFKGKLDSIASGLEKDMRNQLLQLPGTVALPEKLFERLKPVPDTAERKAVRGMQKDKTPGELETEARKRSGGVAGAVYGAGHLVNKAIFDWNAPASPEEAAERAASSGSLEYPGLSVEQGKIMGNALKEYKSGNVQFGQALITQATDATRPDLQRATMLILKDNAPDLYTQARKGIKPDSELGQTLDYIEKNRISNADLPIQQLEMNMRLGDSEAFNELARRASSDGPDRAAAGKMLLDHIKTKQSQRFDNWGKQ